MSPVAHRSLRIKIALGVALPIFLILLSFSLIHYGRERHLVETHVESVALQLGRTTLSSLRHAMALNDDALLRQLLSDVGRLDNIRQVQIIDVDGRVQANSLGRNLDQLQDRGSAGCVECHQSDTPLAQPIRLAFPSGIMRVSLPIHNEAECADCHGADRSLLGTLLVDVSVIDLEQHLLDDLRVDLLFTSGMTVLATLGIYVLIHRLVTHRIAAMRRPLAEFTSGQFTTRLPVSLHPSDEIDALGAAFNRMADELQRHAGEEQARSQVRQRAIVEERERIARELHDGVAQLLGYVSTKALAVRLMLKNRQIDAAQTHLAQLEEAAQEVFVEVREAILGLKMAGRNGEGLPAALREFAAQYNRLSALPVEVSIDPDAEPLPLSAETELQLMRIVQEALTNARKHASATRARVDLRRENGCLELSVRDDGTGFDLAGVYADPQPHFGLSTMRERAGEIGADFSLQSEPGGGTLVRVRLRLKNR
jgi:signal transduction histidine kinase